MDISDPNFVVDGGIDLLEDEVQLWQVDLERMAPAEQRCLRMLAADERQRAGRFHFERDRQRYTITRGVLRMLLGHYVGSDPTQLVFGYAKQEKPFLQDAGEGSRLEFNVSHSGGYAMLAFAWERAVGVDIESIQRDRNHVAIAQRFFSENEQAEFLGLPESERQIGFFRCWTRKEAFIKAIGAGLSMPLGQFDVSLKPGDQDALLATRPDASEAQRWSLRDLPAAEGYAAALCVRGRGWRLKM